jgi:predicted  nucleic acid-binding Zn-ribbon protein
VVSCRASSQAISWRIALAVNMRDSEGLIARIRQIRRARAEADAPPAVSSEEHGQDELHALGERLGRLEERIAHMEALVQGLQDSVHRESTRQSRRIAELEAQIDPATLRQALSRDARERGL